MACFLPCASGDFAEAPAAPVPEVGMPAPDFLLPAADGPIRLSDFRGQPVVLVFSPPGWDPAEAAQLALFNDTAARLAPARVRLLGVSLDGPWCSLDLENEGGLRFPLLRDFDPAGGVAHRFGVYGSRAVVVIDGDGVVQWKHVFPAGMPARPEVLAAVFADLAPPDPIGPSLTRRQFLITALVASVAAAAWPAPAPAETSAASPQGTAPPRQPQVLDLTLQVNGVDHALTVDSRVTLLDALREYIGLTGTKKGCDQGTCGACTVLADGRRIKSCLTLAAMAEGHRITTIEGLAREGKLHPVQAAFIDHDAFQCGYCTPGQIMAAVALIDEGHAGSDDEIREWMSGNLCRCGAYPNIVAAIRQAAGGKKA